MLSRKMTGTSTPGTLSQKIMKRRKAERSWLNALEAKIELLLNETDAIQDQNQALQDQKKRLEEHVHTHASGQQRRVRPYPRGVQPRGLRLQKGHPVEGKRARGGNWPPGHHRRRARLKGSHEGHDQGRNGERLGPTRRPCQTSLDPRPGDQTVHPHQIPCQTYNQRHAQRDPDCGD
ncbi:hypothetical protein GBA52_010621 [Prunus armeniaca]|nr:hypothetical protein GBA52_010621 [Prunus armeniaca]